MLCHKMTYVYIIVFKAKKIHQVQKQNKYIVEWKNYNKSV